MQLIPKGCTDTKEIFHVPTGIGKALIATGVAEEFIPPIKPEQPTRWLVVNGGVAGEYPPFLKASCPVCGHETVVESAKGTAHKTIVLRHHTGPESCPGDVAENYVAAFNNWMRVHRPKQAAAYREQQEALKNTQVVWR